MLISLDDAKTLFHEFGHALHGLLQDVTYPGLSTTPRDFVEYPVAGERALAVDARGARPLRAALPDRRADAAGAGRQGRGSRRHSTRATRRSSTWPRRILDMELHTRPDGAFEPDAFERDELARIGMPREIALRHRLPHFDHLFGSDAYSAGYYSYLWSDVMAADTWQAFLEAGPWDKTLAAECADTSRRTATRPIAPKPIAGSAAAIRT